MLRKFAVALTALVALGVPSMALAEDSSSAFEGRLRAMTARAEAAGFYDRSYAGGYYPYATRSVGLYGYGHGYGYGRVARYRGWGRGCCY